MAARPAVPPPAAVRTAAKKQVPRRTVNEFAGAGSTTRAASPEFEQPPAGETQFTRAASTASQGTAAGAPASTSSSGPSAPEFGGARPAPEFGG